MASLIPGYEYDIFISYRQKDNKYDSWVTEFADKLKKELESTFKEEISVYFDINPHDGLLETHDVEASLKNKLKSLVFIPIVSRTYCDPKSFAWEHELKAFVEQASQDQYGMMVRLPGGNVAARVLPVRIHDLDIADIKLCESILGSVLRGIEFIYKESGVNRPLKPDDDEKLNLNKTKYRNQINKVANAIRELINGIINFEKIPDEERKKKLKEIQVLPGKSRSKLITGSAIIMILIILGFVFIPRIIKSGEELERSVAVLPFRNDSPEDSTQYFMDGVMEELLKNLQRIKSLSVCGRTSVEQYRGQNKTIPEIARELGVNYIIEGSGQKSGNSLRMRVQLIAANKKTEKHIWANSFEQESIDLKAYFKTQSGFAEAIAKELNAALSGQEKKLIEQLPTTDNEAYEAYLKGKFYSYNFDPIDLDLALKYFDLAIEKDPDYSLAYAGIAYVWLVKQQAGFTIPEEAGPKVMESIMKAVELDSTIADVHFILASISYLGTWDWKTSELEFQKALTINPNHAEVHGLYAQLLYILGRPEEAIVHAELSRKLDPLNQFIKMWYGFNFLYEKQYDKTISFYRNVLEMDPTNFAFYSGINEACHLLGRYDEAMEASKLYYTNFYPGIDHIFDLYPKSGYAGIMNLEGDLLVKQSETKYIIPGDIVFLYVMGGNKEKALDWLEKGYELRDPLTPYIGRPFFSSLLLNEPRYQELLRKLSIPSYD